MEADRSFGPVRRWRKPRIGASCDTGLAKSTACSCGARRTTTVHQVLKRHQARREPAAAMLGLFLSQLQSVRRLSTGLGTGCRGSCCLGFGDCAGRRICSGISVCRWELCRDGSSQGCRSDSKRPFVSPCQEDRSNNLNQTITQFSFL